MLDEGLDKIVLKKLNLKSSDPDLKIWNKFLIRYKNPKHKIKIGLIGKYVELQDSYKSILESFIHAGSANEVEVEIISIHSEYLSEKNVDSKLCDLNGVLVAPGFGERGVEGKILAIEYVRVNKIPFFGICLGMQMAVIEFSRNVLGMSNANSTEMNPNKKYPVIDLMKNQKEVVNKGGTMRLGSWKCIIENNSLAYKIYNSISIEERHRHRYEFNSDFLNQIKSKGLIPSGINKETNLVEIIELQNHPWFIGVQFHPEYKSTVYKPHPLFVSFIKAGLINSTQK
jgi:CTP synthase